MTRRVPILWSWVAAVMPAVSLAAACTRQAGAGAWAQPADPGPIASVRIAVPDDSGYLAAGRVATLPAPDRAKWEAYLSRSVELQQRDRALIDREVRDLGRSSMTPAPYVSSSFSVQPYMTGGWFRTEAARAMAEAILSYQTPSGGWSKHVDFSAGSRPKGTSFYSGNASWSYIATIDNNATTEQMRFLALAFSGTGEERYRASLLRGLDYLLDAQYPNGCWPQVYPLIGGYHDAATFNDDAITNAMKVVRDAGLGAPPMHVFTPQQRTRAEAAFRSGLECLLATQVLADGVPTIWAQQHDPLTLVPVRGRSYEPASLASRESAGVTRLLMELPDPDPRVIEAVHSAADWFASHRIFGIRYDPDSGIVEAPGSGPVWARMTDIGTDRPVFSNRDGIILYDWRKLTDRARGYAWFVPDGVAVLEDYARWSGRHPRSLR